MSYLEQLHKLLAKYGMTDITITELNKLAGNPEAYEAFIDELGQLYGIDLNTPIHVFLNDLEIQRTIEESSRN